MSLPAVGPTGPTLERFWKKVAEVTTRYHDPELGWVGGEDVRRWNDTNTQPCERCANSRNGKKCEVDSDHPSCRACRRNKVGCDRKPRFVFDMTKDQFFPSYPHFLRIFQDRNNTQLRRLRRHEYRFKPAVTRTDVVQLANRTRQPKASSVGVATYDAMDIERMARDLEIANRNMRVIYASVRRTMQEREHLLAELGQSFRRAHKALLVQGRCPHTACKPGRLQREAIRGENSISTTGELDNLDKLLDRFLDGSQIYLA
ncbi:hypothetical protein C8R47DRAFT_1079753 [Mycena vitilis]|nr:hypothetical protein C8R47DRAFT_1079753 [Mycena vitilis]